MKHLKRIIFFFSLFIFYFIFKELLELIVLAKTVHPVFGYVTIVSISAFCIYFIVIPLVKLFAIPVYDGPTTDKMKEKQVVEKRLQQFRKSPHLLKIEYDFSKFESESDLYNDIIKIFNVECDKIRKRYISQLFYVSSIAQNGFLDAILILSSSISLIKEIFILYNGRVTNKDLLIIGRNVYYSLAIGGSESVEYATVEFISKLASDSIKSIPFIEKVASSLADGYVNAVLLNRVSYITENYCKLTFIKSKRDIYPSPKFIATATRDITSDFTERLIAGMKRITFEKPVDIAMVAVNPIRYLILKTVDKFSFDSDREDSPIKDTLKEGFSLISSPFNYVFGKFVSSIRK